MAKMIAVSGVKNSGKTTLIEGLIPRLNARGIVTAVIKHDGHSFVPDTPGTDSYRFFAAGACGSAVFDGEKFSVAKRSGASENELAELFPDAELILLEGFKISPYPKLMLLREDEETVKEEDDTILAYVTELPIKTARPVFSRDNVKEIAELLANLIAVESESL